MPSRILRVATNLNLKRRGAPGSELPGLDRRRLYETKGTHRSLGSGTGRPRRILGRATGSALQDLVPTGKRCDIPLYRGRQHQLDDCPGAVGHGQSWLARFWAARRIDLLAGVERDRIRMLESGRIWWYCSPMDVLEQAMRLPRPEKLRLMEALWTDLSLVEEELDSPKWHEAALRETEARVAASEEQQVDWDEAKRLLRRQP